MYPAWPPPALTVAEPVTAPSQFGLALALIVAVTAVAGWVIVAEAVIVQPFLSVTVTV